MWRPSHKTNPWAFSVEHKEQPSIHNISFTPFNFLKTAHMRKWHRR